MMNTLTNTVMNMMSNTMTNTMPNTMMNTMPNTMTNTGLRWLHCSQTLLFTLLTPLSHVNLNKNGYEIGSFHTSKYDTSQKLVLIPGAIFRGNMVHVASCE